jgi:hypothetical protein
MPRYYFDVQKDDGWSVDEVGIELDDMDSAIHQARLAITDMMRDALREQSGEGILIRIRDGADGPVLISVTLTTELPHNNR